jgi:hypothetical protein
VAEPLHLETVFTSPRFFGLTTATPCQRAFCRICEGLALGELASCDDVREAVGGSDALAILAPGSFRPREFDLLAAIRSAKSLFVASHFVWSSQTAQVEHTRASDTLRYVIMSVNLQSADATFTHLAGTMMGNPLLRKLLVGEPGDGVLRIRHPSGRVIECVTAAGARAGANLVSVWLVGAAFEEFPRQAGEASGAAINYDQQLQSAAGRVLEGGQIVNAGAPWAPFGPAFERFTSHFGKPTPERVVVRAGGPQMNPSWWTPERCEALQRSNPTAYITDVLAGFADVSTNLIPSSDLRRNTRPGPVCVPATPGAEVLFVLDPASRGNAFVALGVEFMERGDGTTTIRVIYARQWIGSAAAPLRPDRVLEEIACDLRERYGVREAWSDNYAPDFVVDIAARHGLEISIEMVTAASKLAMFTDLASRIADSVVEIPDDATFRSDLQNIRKLVTRNGVAIDLPRTADGRHGDYAAALALAVSKAGHGGLPAWCSPNFAQGVVNQNLIPFDSSALGSRGTGQWVGAPTSHGGDIEQSTAADGEIWLTGVTGKWPPMSYARFFKGQPSRFSVQCTGDRAFERAIANYREVHQL